MAGIGFELRKLLKKQSLMNKIKAWTSATFVAVGPMLMSILLIIFIDKILELGNISMFERETIKATIMYAYVFSMINASGFIMIISRYIADKFFIKDTTDILSSLLGVIASTLLIGGTFAGIFYYKSPIPNLQKYISYIIFIELSILYILMAYISAIKNYKMVAISFGLGTAIGVILSGIILYIKVDIVLGILFAVSIGYFVNIMVLIYAVKKHFGVLSKNTFGFLSYIKEHYKLFLTGLFYTIAMFIHNILFWRFSNINLNIMGTYYYAPAYDTASFFAVLTIIPAAILFVVKFETTFYERYIIFQNCLLKGSLKDLVIAKERMIDTLKRELTFIMEIQIIMSIVLTVLGVYVILPIFANDSLAIELYIFLAIGFFMSFMTYIIMVVLLYFDLQKETLIISSIFLISTFLFTFLSIYLGQEYYGLGYNISSIISLIMSLHYLNKEIGRIDYRIYSK